MTGRFSRPWLQSLREACDVYPDAEAGLDLYKDALRKWGRSINLVGPKTLEDLEDRHFVDSARLLRLMPRDARRVVDFGSGAGFPGLVLALLSDKISVQLIESDQKKCSFLRHVSRETNSSARVDVLCSRIEAAQVGPVDVLTARALAPLSQLCVYAAPWFEVSPGLVCLFPKGRQVREEIEAARADWAFEDEIVPSAGSSADDGGVVVLRDLKDL